MTKLGHPVTATGILKLYLSYFDKPPSNPNKYPRCNEGR